MVLIHTTLGRGTLKLGIKFYSPGNILQYWLETGGKNRISFGKIKQAVDMKYKYCSITSAILWLFLLGGHRRWGRQHHQKAWKKITHSVRSLKSFLNGNYIVHYVLPINNLINKKNLERVRRYFLLILLEPHEKYVWPVIL